MHCDMEGVSPISTEINKGVKQTFTFELDGKNTRTFTRLISVATDKGGIGCLMQAKDELKELLMKEGESVANWRIPLYTINVKMVNGSGRHTESSAVDAFSDIARALSFYERLVSNLATPIDLIYVLEDEVSN